MKFFQIIISIAIGLSAGVKLIAEQLGIPYYDSELREIIEQVAEEGVCVIVGRRAD